MVTYNKRPGFAREEAVGGTPLTYFKSGTITSIDDQVVLEAPGSGSATVVIKGTFTGTLQAVGSSTEDYATKGGRLLFQSGVGSTGSNKVVGDGTAINKEFRIVSGGRYIIIEPTAWTSGSATVEVYASQAASTIFINGPVNSCLASLTS